MAAVKLPLWLCQTIKILISVISNINCYLRYLLLMEMYHKPEPIPAAAPKSSPKKSHEPKHLQTWQVTQSSAMNQYQIICSRKRILLALSAEMQLRSTWPCLHSPALCHAVRRKGPRPEDFWQQAQTGRGIQNIFHCVRMKTWSKVQYLTEYLFSPSVSSALEAEFYQLSLWTENFLERILTCQSSICATHSARRSPCSGVAIKPQAPLSCQLSHCTFCLFCKLLFGSQDFPLFWDWEAHLDWYLSTTNRDIAKENQNFSML